jgi:hypothetical protein
MILYVRWPYFYVNLTTNLMGGLKSPIVLMVTSSVRLSARFNNRDYQQQQSIDYSIYDCQ